MGTYGDSPSRPRTMLLPDRAPTSRWRPLTRVRAPLLAYLHAARALMSTSLAPRPKGSAAARIPWLALSGPALTLALAVAFVTPWAHGLVPIQPTSLLLAAIVYSICISGMRLGLVSAAIALLCDGYYILAHADSPEAAIGDLVLLFLVVPACFVLVASLRHQAETGWVERERRLREQATADALRQSQAQMDEALSLTSHELRSPLTSIRVSVQQAQRRLRTIRAHRVTSPDLSAANGTSPDHTVLDALRAPCPASPTAHQLDDASVSYLDEALDFLARIDGNVGKLDRMSRDLLDAARLRTDHFSLEPKPCDLVTLVAEVVTEQRSLFPNRAVTLAAPALPVLVEVDALRIGQVVGNYLSNAFKYSPADQPIEVTITASAATARVAVRDHGPGIPAAERERIWERFERIRSSAAGHPADVCPTGGDLGLGLYLCRGYVERSGGAVGVEGGGEPGENGATFWLTLPLLCA